VQAVDFGCQQFRAAVRPALRADAENADFVMTDGNTVKADQAV